MIRRWLIRGLALTLLALCVVAWVGSYWRGVRIRYNSGSSIEVCFDDGRIGFSADQASHLKWWALDFPRSIEGGWNYWDANATYRGLGFGFYRDELFWVVITPLWCPTLLSALLLWIVWRKTRAKPVGRAFPVEPAKAGEQRS